MVDVHRTMQVIQVALHQALKLRNDDPTYKDLCQRFWLFAVEEADRLPWKSIDEYYGSLNHWVRTKAYRWMLENDKLVRGNALTRPVSASRNSGEHDGKDDWADGGDLPSNYPELSMEPEQPKEDLNWQDLFQKAGLLPHEVAALMHSFTLPTRKNSDAVARGTWQRDALEFAGLMAIGGVLCVRVGPGFDPDVARVWMAAVRKLVPTPEDPFDPNDPNRELKDPERQFRRYTDRAIKKLQKHIDPARSKCLL